MTDSKSKRVMSTVFCNPLSCGRSNPNPAAQTVVYYPVGQWLVALLLLLTGQTAVAGVTTPFSVRYSTNTTGNIAFAANTLMTAPASDPAAANAQNGVGSKLSNNDFNMVYVDIDSDASTFNSSQSQLVLPAGSQVLFAGLYWGARTNTSYPTGLTSRRNQIKFMAPGDSSYRDLVGSTIGTVSSSYHAFYDVTSIVSAAGPGYYTVANVQAVASAADFYAGWSLVVVYQAPGEPARNLTVFDGYASVTSSDPAVTINVSGFTAPPTGPVTATLGFITYEGDLGYNGDKVIFNGGLGNIQLSDAANPANNFFNSTIANLGSLVSTKQPDYVNQLGYDADLVAANSAIANNATRASISLTTGGETYYPGVVTSAIELYAPEVIVQKSVVDLNGGTTTNGDILRYTITVTNQAGALDAADNVVLKDFIPAGTTYNPNSLVVNSLPKSDAVDADQAEYLGSGSAAVQFQLGTGAGGGVGSPVGGTLAPGAATTVSFEVVVNAGTLPELIQNTATATYVGQTSRFALSATDSADIATSPSAVDLSVTKTDGVATYVPGQSLIYTLVVSNAGPGVATGASVTDQMPAELDGVAWTAVYSAGSSGPASGSGDINVPITLPVGGTATFTVTASASTSAFGNLSNTVTVTPPSGSPDPDLSNNIATDIDTLLYPASLTVQKTVQDLTPPDTMVLPGDELLYTLTLANSGTDPAETLSTVSLLDPIPAHTAYQAGSLQWVAGVLPTTLTDTGSPLSASYTQLTQGQTSTLTFKVRVDAGLPDSTLITNTATATATGQSSGLPYSGTGSVAVYTPPAADLSVVKSGPATFTPGATVSYSLVATNTGPTDVTGATLTDSLDPSISGASWTASYSGGASGTAAGSGNVNATLNLPVGGVATISVTGWVASAFPLTDMLLNTATLTSPLGVPDPDTSNNTSTTSSRPSAITDLAIVKTADSPGYDPGDTITYRIRVSNLGPSFAQQVSVIDDLPPAQIASATWTATYTGLGSQGPASGSGSLGEIIDLAAGGSAEFTIVARTTALTTTDVANTATVGVLNLSIDPDSSNNSSTVTVEPNADLSVDKTVDTLTPQVGQTVTFSVTAHNAGPVNATGVVVTDTLPAGYVLLQATPSTGSYANGVWSLGALARDASATLQIQARVNLEGPYENIANISGDQNDPAPDNNRGQVTPVPVDSADLVVTKSVDNPAPAIGETVVFTVMLVNQGPSTASSIVVDDKLPSGYGLLKAQPSSGHYDAASGRWTINTLANGDLATLRLSARVRSSGTYANTAQLADREQADPDPSNDSATSAPGVNSADLAVSKSVDKTAAAAGETVTFTLTVANDGPATATGVSLTDVLPSGYLFVAAEPAAAYVPATGVWTVGTLPVGASAALRLTAVVRTAGQMTNTLAVTHSDQPDPVSTNNTAEATTGLTNANLVVTKSVNRPAAKVGQKTQFTLTVTNQGPATATGLTLADPLPSGLAFVSAQPKGVYDARSGQWTVAQLAAGASSTLTVTGKVLAQGAYQNSVRVARSEQGDASSSDQTAEASLNRNSQKALVLKANATSTCCSRPIGLSLTGGSGTAVPQYRVESSGGAGCQVKSTGSRTAILRASGQSGSCTVVAFKPASGQFAATVSNAVVVRIGCPGRLGTLTCR